MRLGVLGGGQLGRMIALAAYPLGVQVRLFDPSADSCGGQVTELQVGSYDDRDALKRFAAGLDVITYEFENVPVDAAEMLLRYAPVLPTTRSLEVAQDRLIEKRFFRDLGIPTPEFEPVDAQEHLKDAVARFGLPVVLKTRRMGYDGKGQFVISNETEIDHAWRQLGQYSLIVEAFVPFERELSILAVRARDGSTAFYPLVENQHREGILRTSRTPAQGVDQDLKERAERYASRAMRSLDYVGVLAIEFFVSGDNLLANEMAPRVHNSGHWTIEGAETSQFENHVRAVCGFALGSTEPIGSSIMLNIVGDLPDSRAVLELEAAHLHLYGKEPRPGRKLGHVTVRSDRLEEIERRIAPLVSVLA